MRAVAIDDEPLALSVVEHFCRRVPFVTLEKTFTDSVEGLHYIRENRIELVFLDINIPHLDGIELAHALSPGTKIIFTTAYQNFALEGFELQAVDYLLKPFSFDRFLRAVERAERLIGLERGKPDGEPSLSVKVNYLTRNIRIRDIVYIEGLKDYVKIATEGKNYVTKQTMKTLESTLAPYGFFRIHKSFIVDRRKIVSYNGSSVEMEGNAKIPVGNQYKSAFLEAMDAVARNGR